MSRLAIVEETKHGGVQRFQNGFTLFGFAEFVQAFGQQSEQELLTKLKALFFVARFHNLQRSAHSVHDCDKVLGKAKWNFR